MMTFVVLEQLREDLEQSCWTEAATKRLGAGLAGPANLAPVRRVKRKYQQEGLHTEAAWVDKVVSAGLFLGQRRLSTWPDIPTDCCCPRCGAPHTEAHAFWHCPSLNTHEHPAVQNSQYLAPKARAQLAAARPQEAFWLRGLLPVNVVMGIEPPKLQQETVLEPAEAEMGYAGEVCTDGSGGRHTSRPFLRRCGWCAIQLTGSERLFAAYGPLPGSKQTSARAELYAVVQVAANMVGDVRLWTDHEAIPRILSSQPMLGKAELLENSDLWIMLRESLQHSVHKLEVRWINSHSDRDVKEHGIGHDPDIPMHAYEGNKLADDLARKGADEHEVDAQAAQQQIELEQEAEEVLRRLVVLALEGCREIGNVPKRPVTVARPRVTLQQEIEVMERITRHKALRLSNKSLHCLVCFAQLGREAQAIGVAENGLLFCCCAIVWYQATFHPHPRTERG